MAFPRFSPFTSVVLTRKNFPSMSPIKRKLSFNNDDENKSVKLRIKILTENGIPPKRGSIKAAGYDLYAAYNDTVQPGKSCMIKTDIAMAIPPGYYGRVAPRSGLALKNSIDVGAGVIDEDYRGNVGVLLFNHGDQPFNVKRGDRIAQLILEKIITPDIEEVDELDVTERNANGFGSTGVEKSPIKHGSTKA